MGWTPIASFTGDNVPNLWLEPGRDYLLRIQFPEFLPTWVAGALGNYLAVILPAVSVNVSGNVVDITFRV